MVKIIRQPTRKPEPKSSPKGIVDTAWDTAKNAASLYKNYADLSSPEQQLRGLSQLGQGAAEGTASLLGLPGTLYNIARGGTGRLASLFGSQNPLPENNIVPTSGNLQKGVQDIAKAILPESHLKPQGLREEFARELGSFIPTTAATIATGGAAAPAIARGIGGAAGSTLGQKIFGPIGGIIGGFAGALTAPKLTKLFNSAAKKGADPETLQGAAEHAQKYFYNEAEELGKDINLKIPGYKDKLETIEKQIHSTTALTPSDKTELLAKTEAFISDINGGGYVNAAKMAQRDKEINAVYKAGKGSEYKHLIKEMKDTINDYAEKFGTWGPAKKWYESWQSAKEVTKALKYNTAIGDLIEDSPKLTKIITNPLVKGLLGGGALGSGLGYLTPWGPVVNRAIGAGAGIAAGKAAQLWGFWRQPRAQHLLGEAFKYSTQRNIPALGNTLKQLNRTADIYEKKNPEQGERTPKIIRKGT